MATESKAFLAVLFSTILSKLVEAPKSIWNQSPLFALIAVRHLLPGSPSVALGGVSAAVLEDALTVQPLRLSSDPGV